MFSRISVLSTSVAKNALVICLFSSLIGASFTATAVAAPGAQKAAKAAAKAGAKTSASKAAANTIPTNGRPKIIDASATWCVPCKKLAPIFEKLKTTYAAKADFQSLDIDQPDGKAFADKFNINSVPAIMMFDASGKLVFRHEGLMNESELTTEINKVVH